MSDRLSRILEGADVRDCIFEQGAGDLRVGDKVANIEYNTTDGEIRTMPPLTIKSVGAKIKGTSFVYSPSFSAADVVWLSKPKLVKADPRYQELTDASPRADTAPAIITTVSTSPDRPPKYSVGKGKSKSHVMKQMRW